MPTSLPSMDSTSYRWKMATFPPACEKWRAASFFTHGAATPHHAGHCHLVSALHFSTVLFTSGQLSSTTFQLCLPLSGNFCLSLIWQTLQQSALSCILPGCCLPSAPFSTGSNNYTTCSGPLRDTTDLSVWVLLFCTLLLNHRSSFCLCLTAVNSILTRLFSSAAWSPVVLFPGSKPLPVPRSYCCLFACNFTCKCCHFPLQHALLNSPLPLPSTSPMLTHWNHKNCYLKYSA